MATQETNYPAGSSTTSITIAPENIASSATFVAGVESNYIDNTTTKDLDHLISGIWTSGTTPVINTQVQIWIITVLSDDLAGTVVWPDVFDGTSSAETVTSAGMLEGMGRKAAVLTVDSTTSNRTYPCAQFSVAALFGGSLPSRYVMFITHNTGVNSNTTAGNHSWRYQRIKRTV